MPQLLGDQLACCDALTNITPILIPPPEIVLPSTSFWLQVLPALVGVFVGAALTYLFEQRKARALQKVEYTQDLLVFLNSAGSYFFDVFEATGMTVNDIGERVHLETWVDLLARSHEFCRQGNVLVVRGSRVLTKEALSQLQVVVYQLSSLSVNHDTFREKGLPPVADESFWDKLAVLATDAVAMQLRDSFRIWDMPSEETCLKRLEDATRSREKG